jgi:hypothetical protein
MLHGDFGAKVGKGGVTTNQKKHRATIATVLRTPIKQMKNLVLVVVSADNLP